MSLPSSEPLSQFIARTPLSDPSARAEVRGRVRLLLVMLDGDSPTYLHALEAALLILDRIEATPEEAGPLTGMVASLVALVEGALEARGGAVLSGAPRAARPVAPPTQAPPPAHPTLRFPEEPVELASGKLHLVNELLLGQILIDLGWIQARDVLFGLSEVAESGVRFGEALVRLGLLSEAHVEAALGRQVEMRARTAGDEHGAVGQAPPGDQSPAAPVAAPAERFRPSASLRVANEFLLGEILIARGLIHRGQLQAALERQRGNGWLLGRTLLEMGAVSNADLQAALGTQRKRPA